MCWYMGPMTFYLLGFDDVKFSPPYDKLLKTDGARDVVVIVPRNNGGYAKVPVD